MATSPNAPAADPQATAERKRVEFAHEALPQIDFLYAFAQRLAGDVAVAEDLVQDTMFAAWRSWHSYHLGSNARAWLATILRRIFLNLVQRERLERRAVGVHEIEHLIPDERPWADPERTLLDRELRDDVVGAIEALPAEFRDSVVLTALEGRTYSEVAQATGAPIGTVKSRLFRGRQSLAGALYEHAVDTGYVRAGAGSARQ